ncbi:MAG: N-acetylmuramoyl-L-alanine amidase [Hyphomicrobiales bacterium]
MALLTDMTGTKPPPHAVIARACALLLAFLLLLPLPALATEPVATGTRVGGDEHRTRFVTDLTQVVSFTAYVLPDPYRVVVDLPEVAFDLPPGAGRKVRGLITEFRYGVVEYGRARIVIDTSGPVLIEKSFVIGPQAGQPARLVVDLVKTSEAAFLKTYKSEARKSQSAAASPLPRPKPGTEASPLPEKQVAAKPKHGRKLVVIDPGHGGIDPGAIGRNKTKEKDVVLAFGHALRLKLEADGKYDVVMTRTGDGFVSLRDRVRLAREREADLLIAIHADIVRGQSARGATIYTLSDKASDAEAEALAQKENRADIIAGLDLEAGNEDVTGILIDLVQRESKTHSVFFARKAVAEMRAVTGFTGKPLRSAGFVVLKAPDVPSVLVELGYLSSKTDEQQLNSQAWRDRTAAALARAIDKYFSTEIAARTSSGPGPAAATMSP